MSERVTSNSQRMSRLTTIGSVGGVLCLRLCAIGDGLVDARTHDVARGGMCFT